MQISAVDLLNILSSVQSVVASSLLTNTEKTVVLRDIQAGLPPEQLCAAKQTRAIALIKISEAIDGLQPKEAQSKKPVQKGTGKVSTKGPKKQLLLNSNADRRGAGTKA